MKKIILAAIIVIIIIAVFLLNNINPIVKKGVETGGSKVLSAPVSLNNSDISIFSGSGALAGLTIGNPAGFNSDYAFQLKQVKVDLDVKSVTSDTIHIKNILIDGPSIIFEGGFGKSNLSQLLANAKAFSGGEKKDPAVKSEEKSTSQPKKILIDNVTIANGSISVSMNILQGQKLTVPLPTLELSDIGKKGDTTAAEAMEQILTAITQAVIPAVQAGMGTLDIEKNIQETGKALQEGAQKKLDTFKGLLGN
ncbi:MAG: AsmA family protein [Desulfobulbaceae bacterium]|uniref:AsmA family protein n=1 Tax=Candidatus Desulfobia pelagia TaxID=2841692 RepID=A0A8J6TFU6_9BACT|nr:AsmA family protein [Candidatus Desulfobia pelagia]